MSLVSTLLLSLLVQATAHADVNVTDFSWKTNGRFFVDLSVDGQVDQIKGDLLDGQSADATSKSGITAHVTSYDKGESLISIVLSTDDSDLASLIIAEGPKEYTKINDTPIMGRKATLLPDLQAAIEGLKKLYGWDAALAIRKLIEFNDQNPQKTVEDFMDQVELGTQNVVPHPRQARSTDGKAPDLPVSPKKPALVVQKQPAPVQKQSVAPQQVPQITGGGGLPQGGNPKPLPVRKQKYNSNYDPSMDPSN